MDQVGAYSFMKEADGKRGCKNAALRITRADGAASVMGMRVRQMVRDGPCSMMGHVGNRRTASQPFVVGMHCLGRRREKNMHTMRAHTNIAPGYSLSALLHARKECADLCLTFCSSLTRSSLCPNRGLIFPAVNGDESAAAVRV